MQEHAKIYKIPSIMCFISVRQASGVHSQQQYVSLQEEWPLLIIVPASLRLVWAEELEKWLPHLRPSSIHVIEGKSDRLQGSDLPAVCITSYEMMQRLTCEACKGTDGCPVVLTACAGSQVQALSIVC